jgi:3-oxoacyl-[acyl-carrier protein] reductase
MKLCDKVAIVTGASKGIGAAIAKGIAQAGAKVVANYASDHPGAEKTVAAIRAAGGRAVAVKADVSKSSDVQELFEQTIRTFGRLDILVNNAGVYRFEPFEAVTEPKSEIKSCHDSSQHPLSRRALCA